MARPQLLRQETVAPKRKKDAPLMNRFHLLNMDGAEDGSLEDDDHDTSELTLSSAVPPTLLAS
jgi:hypothetical protein